MLGVFQEKKPGRRIYAKKKIKYKLIIKKREVNEEDDDSFVDVEDDDEEDDAAVDEEDVGVDEEDVDWEDVAVDEEDVVNEEDDGGEEDVDVDEEDHVNEEEVDAVTIEDFPKYLPSYHDKKKRPYSGSNKQAKKCHAWLLCVLIPTGMSDTKDWELNLDQLGNFKINMWKNIILVFWDLILSILCLRIKY
jgi:hypothetical protein